MNKHAIGRTGTAPVMPHVFIHKTAVVNVNGVILSADDVQISYGL